MKLKKFISSSLAIGLIFNSVSTSFASILSEDGRYETFKGNNITIDNILEEDKVDVEIEGNTMVNVANQKDPVPITKAYTVKGTNHIPLQGEYDGKARPVIEGNTMYYNNDTGELTDTFIEGANLSLASSFEDQLITQEMVDSGIEKAENLGKYKVEYKVIGKNKFNGELERGYGYAGIGLTVNGYQEYLRGTTLIPVKENTYYNIYFEDIDNYVIPNQYGFLCFNSNKELIANSGYNDKIPIGTRYILPTFKTNQNPAPLDAIKNIQIEEGTTATEYEPYKESIKTFYLNSPLLEGDTIEDIDGKATHVRRYNKLLLDNNNFELRSDNSFRWNITNSKYPPKISDVQKIDISDKILTRKPIVMTSINSPDGIAIYPHSSINSEIIWRNSSFLTIEEAKQWLSENPTTIIYELANPIYETISDEPMLCDSYANGHLDLNTDIPVNKVDFIPTTTDLNYLYPSTKYTVQFESDSEGKIDRVLLGDEFLYVNYSVNKGINRFNITTPSVISSTKLILDGVGFNLSNLVVTEAIDKDFDYFEGIKSVGQDDENGHKIEIVSNNKNLFDGELVHGYWYQASFRENENAIANLNNIPVQPNTDYTFFIEGYNELIYIAEMDKNYNEVKSFRIKSNEYITTTSSAKYLRFCTDMNYALPLDINVQIQKGSSATNYIEQQSNKVEILLSEPLRSLPNGAKDRIIKRNGQWVVERNCGEVTLDGSEDWRKSMISGWKKQSYYTYKLDALKSSNAVIQYTKNNKLKDVTPNDLAHDLSVYGITQWSFDGKSCILLNIKEVSNIDELKDWLSNNPVTVVYQLNEPIYELLNIDSEINIYLDITHISNISNIPANMKVTVDRTMNRAIEAIEVAKNNPTVSNISEARYWTNLLKESIKKDELQSEINSITNIENLQLEKKTTTANMDIYIKSENALSLSLSDNSITFEDFNGTEDLEQNRALEISINSSLPYEINAYLEEEVQNADKTAIMDKRILNLKESSTSDYKEFTDVKTKLTLVPNSDAGNNKIHNFDFKLNGGIAHKADVYKTTIKFEAVQK